MHHCFRIGRARIAALARPLPVPHRLLGTTRLGVVLRQDFGLPLRGLGPLGLEDLGNALVDLLPRALQERLIRRLLGEHMLKGVVRAGSRRLA